MRLGPALCEAVGLTWVSRLLPSFAMMRHHDAVLVVLMTIAALGAGRSAIRNRATATPRTPRSAGAAPCRGHRSDQPDCRSGQSSLRQPPTRELPPGGTPPPANSGLCT